MEDFMPIVERTNCRPIGFAADFDAWEINQKSEKENKDESVKKSTDTERKRDRIGSFFVQCLILFFVALFVYAQTKGLG